MNEQTKHTPHQEGSETSRDAEQRPAKKISSVEPTLAAYFGAKPVATAAFFKAVSNAKVERFTQEDIATAATCAVEHDPVGGRLLQLVGQSGKPKAIDRWVWQAVQAFLRSKVPDAFVGLDADADTTFRRVHRELQGGLVDADPAKRKQAETLLSLTLTWLANQRSLDLVKTLEQLQDSFPATSTSIRETVRKSIADGKVSTLKRLAAVATLLGDTLRESRSTLLIERQRSAATEARLNEARSKISILEAEIVSLKQAHEKLAAAASDAAHELRDRMQHAGHDIVELRAEQSAFLHRRIAPLLNDAVDALEDEPPAPHIALKRIKTAIRDIGEEDE